MDHWQRTAPLHSSFECGIAKFGICGELIDEILGTLHHAVVVTADNSMRRRVPPFILQDFSVFVEGFLAIADMQEFNREALEVLGE